MKNKWKNILSGILSIFMFVWISGPAMVFADTITFNGGDNPDTGISIVKDGDLGTTDVSGVVYQFYLADASGVASGIHFESLSNPLGDHYSALLSIQDNGANYGGVPMWVINRQDGASFSVYSIRFIDGYTTGQTQVKVEGFKNGISTGSDLINLNLGTLNTLATLTASKFSNVDKVQLTNPNADTNYLQYVGINSITINPAIEPTPTVTTTAASSIGQTAATLNGTVNGYNDNTNVIFEYGTTSSYGTTATAAQSPVKGNSDTNVSYVLSGLAPNTTYHYRVVGTNGAGATSGNDLTFTTLARVATVSTSAASGISSTAATLKGTVNANNASTTVTFEYGITASYGSTVNPAQSPVTGSSDTNVSYGLSGLVPNTTYHYRVVGVNTAGTTNGSDLTFKTSAIAPTATTDAASSINSTAATLNGTVNANNASTTVTFQYGLDTNYGTTITAAESPVTGISGTTVSYGLTGLAPNTTYHYRVVGANSAGTTNGSDATFTTPAITSSVTTDAASSISSTGATLKGTINANNATTAVSFEYGTSTSYGSTAIATPSSATGNSATSVSYGLTGLEPNTTYHYRVVGVNTAGTTNGSDVTFTTSAVVPTATTDAASDINSTAATLNGTVNANNASTTVTFEYGIDTSYGTSVTATPSTVTGSSATPVSYGLSGLVPNTTYHYRVVGVNTAGTTNGSDLTFKTSAIAPTATTASASSINSTAATLNGTVNANNAITTVTFEYGTSTSYGSTATATPSTVSGISATNVSYGLSGLIPNTTYHYRVVGTNIADTTNGDDFTFTTPAIAPTATTASASGISSTVATLNGTVNANNSNTTVTFQYGTSTSYGSTATATPSTVTGIGATPVSYGLSGLEPNTTYHYRVVGVNIAGTTNGSDETFTTSAIAPTATTASASGISSTVATLNGTVNANNSNTTVIFEYGTSTSYGSTAIATPSSATGNSATSVSYGLTGLEPNTTYHYRVVGVNTAGTTNGSDVTFTTSAVVPTATTASASGVNSTAATLNGTINANNATTAVTFEYGTSISYGSTAIATPSSATGNSATSVSYGLSGLVPNTTYHYRVVGTNSAGTTNGSDLTFTTIAIAPTATTNAAGNVGSIAAVLYGTVNANNSITTATFEYGLDTGYGTTVSVVSSPISGINNTLVSEVISGLLPNTTYHYRVVSNNATGTTYGTDMSFTTNAALLIGTTSVPSGTVGTVYSGYTFTAIGGNGSKTYAITAGSLPAGISLSADGALSGTPTTIETSNFTVTVTDSYTTAVTNSHAYTMTINPAALVIGTSNPVAGTVGTVYSGHTFTATGGTGSKTYAVTAGSLPAGISLAADGTLSGTPTAAGSSNFTVTATDSATPAVTASHVYAMTINPIATESTVQGNVVDKTGKSIKGIETKVTAEVDGTKTVAMKALDTVVFKETNGIESAISDGSKLGFSGTGSGNVTVAADGTLKVQGLANGTETKLTITYDLGNGVKINLGTIDIKVDANGVVSVVSTLIDPYGTITDSATGKVISGVEVKLYYANTARNIAAGKTPDSLVVLPEIAGFKPNDNKNPQVSDASGAYGFMVFPTSDYYIVAKKAGYEDFKSGNVAVENEIVKFDFKMDQQKAAAAVATATTTTLPKTGSPIDLYTLLALGVLLIGAGGVVLISKRGNLGKK